MAKRLTEKEIEKIRKMQRSRKWILPLIILFCLVYLFAGLTKIYGINKICHNTSLTWERVFDTSFHLDNEKQYLGIEIRIAGWLQKSIFLFSGMLFILLLYFLSRSEYKRHDLLIEYIDEEKSNKIDPDERNTVADQSVLISNHGAVT